MMSPGKQVLGLSALAVVAYFGLRSLPDTQCTFMHAEHQPVLADGLEFCGVNEEANFYSPKAMRFPVQLKVVLAEGGPAGEVRLLKDNGHPYYAHEIKVSHTRQVHLHLRQLGGARLYAHLHPSPADDGAWRFTLPAHLADGSPLGAYVDFTDIRTGRTMLAEAMVQGGAARSAATAPLPRNRVAAMTLSSDVAGSSAMVRFTLTGPPGRPLRLKPIMGSLGHVVVFSVEQPTAGYAHLHPTLEGGEYEPEPVLAFRLRLPAAGTYDLWLNLNDGEDELLRTTLVVRP